MRVGPISLLSGSVQLNSNCKCQVLVENNNKKMMAFVILLSRVILDTAFVVNVRDITLRMIRASLIRGSRLVGPKTSVQGKPCPSLGT